MSCRQYRDRFGDPDWFFREYLAALTDGQLRAVVAWNRERAQHDDTRDDATHRITIVQQEWVRRHGEKKRAGRIRPALD